MTEQERISAIDELAMLLCKRYRGKKWQKYYDRQKGVFKDIAVATLRTLHDSNDLSMQTVLYRALEKSESEASEHEKSVCKNAVQAVQEMVESEKKDD